MQVTIREVWTLFSIALVALASSLITNFITIPGLSSTQATWAAVTVTAVAFYAAKTVFRAISMSTPTLRWLLDSRSAVEGYWIERVESPVESEGRTYSLVKIEYNASLNGYIVQVWNFDLNGREIRFVSSSQMDFSAGCRKITYRYSGNSLPTGTNPELGCNGEPARRCSGFGYIEFVGQRFGRYSYARGEFIDCTPSVSCSQGDCSSGCREYPRRVIRLRRIRNRELSRILTKDPVSRDPLPRLRHIFSRRPYQEPYKNHDMSRIVLDFMRQTRLQDESLSGVVMKDEET